jgi:hypothetical protein
MKGVDVPTGFGGMRPPPRGAQRSGAETRAPAGGSPAARAVRLAPGRAHCVPFKAVFLSPPRGGASGRSSREGCRPGSPPESVLGGVPHLLLSEQLRPGSTPIVSFESDGGDRGVRPI